MIPAILNAIAMLTGVVVHGSRDERAQDTFEYVLIIGGVVVAVILAVTTPIGTSLINAVVTGVCTAVSGIVSITCTGL